jgi:hypothetical protein
VWKCERFQAACDLDAGLGRQTLLDPVTTAGLLLFYDEQLYWARLRREQVSSPFRTVWSAVRRTAWLPHADAMRNERHIMSFHTSGDGGKT